MLGFTEGWLHRFKTRKGIKSRQQHGKEGSVPEDAKLAMESIRERLSPYALRDRFNCDETALYWKRLPDRTLATKQLPGCKKEKARLTAYLCCNADASERIKPLFIGTAKQPRAFSAASVNIANLDMTWRNNKKG
jgi:hypothetical protein